MAVVDNPEHVLADRLIRYLEEEVLKVTTTEVGGGSLAFGAAVLKADPVAPELLVASANRIARTSPLFHGETSAIHDYYQLPKEGRPRPQDCVLLSSHEPCPMCTAAVCWANIPVVYYVWTYAETASMFVMPKDEAMCKDVFGTDAPTRENQFFKMVCIRDMIKGNTALERRIDVLEEAYVKLAVAAAADSE